MNPIANGVLGGWEVSTVTLWQTGPYLTPVTSPAFDTANLNLVYRGALLRPDCVGSPIPANQTADKYFNMDAFNAVPAPWADGEVRGRHYGGAKDFVDHRLGQLSKTFAIGEKAHLRFEATFTNLPNHPNFAPPAVDVSAPATFGKITTVQSAENSGNRTGQLALRLDF